MKKILVVWPTHREDWIFPFEELSEDFEFVFLSGIAEDSNQQNYVSGFAKTVYWSSYRSAQEIISDIEPFKIIFMSVDSGLNIVLNIVAKDRGITTYLLQHGIYTNYKDYRIREKLWKKNEVASKNSLVKQVAGFSSFNFIKNSLKGWQKLYLIPIALFIKTSQIKGPYWAAKHFSFEGKRPTTYICFSPYNAIIHEELDRIEKKRIEYIGSPELAKYLERESDVIGEDFYLHIDQAFAENSFGEETVSKESMIQFYLKLNSFCLQQKAKLYIKLHPETYHSQWLPEHENIVYLRKVNNFNRYIQSAQGCFGFYSTMVIPAIYWKPTILFNIFYSGLQEALKDIDQVKILPFFEFLEDDLIFPGQHSEKDKLIKRFLYSKEPIALKLLAKILNAEN